MAGVGVGKTLHKLRVVNLPWTVSDLQLKQYFSQFGFIDQATVIFNKRTGLSQQYGFIEMTNQNTYENIYNQNHDLEGQHIFVKEMLEK